MAGKGRSAGADDRAAGPLSWAGPGPRFGWGGRRDLYDRRLQSASERWPLPARAARAMFSRPELLLALLGRAGPVVRDGRVLDRGVQAMLELVERGGGRGGRGRRRDGGHPDRLDAAVLRSGFAGFAPAVMPARTDVYVTGREVPATVDAPAIPVRVYRRFGLGSARPDGPARRPPAIVYFHGGGWVIGDLDTHDATCRLLAAVSGCVVVSVGYRLAPEDPFPAAVEDALAAYRWVHGRADELGFAPGRVGVMGDSAGGNLAAVVSLEARSGQPEGVPPPIAQVLVYPVVDTRFDTGSFEEFGDGFLLTRAEMELFRDAYLPEGVDRDSPRVSPLRAKDHAGVAPALVVTAGFDPLRDGGAAYADVLRSAGVEVEYRCYDDQVHGFMGMGFLPVSLQLATEVSDAAGRLMRRCAFAERD